MAGRWYFTYEESETGGFVAYATETPLPRNPSARDIFLWPGEVHFAFGATVEQARDELERSLTVEAS